MLLGALQENLLTLLTFDKVRAPIIRGAIDPALYGGIYRTISARIYDYIDKYKKPPGDHLPDILVDKIETDSREASLYIDAVESIHASHKGINAEYIMSQLEVFIKRQSMRTVAIDLAKALQRDTEESLEEAERLISTATRASLTLFDPGTRLSDSQRALKFLDIAETAFPTGIPELDKRGFGPTRKEMSLFIGDTSAGKTWWLIQLAKMALMHRTKVCHITLEMSEDRSAQRYIQTLFAVSKRKEIFNTTKFELDNLGRISGFEERRVKPRLSLDDPSIRRKLEAKIKKWSPRLLDNIIIKQFPGGSLTVNNLTAYLDNLEATERFVPDLLIVDYPDLMKISTDNYRLSLDQIYKDLRGLMVTRNIAGAIVSQSNRLGAKAKQVGKDNVAEAYSKIAHVDTAITYTQTPQEHKLGLARLHVAKGRNDQDKLTIVISQQYGIGNFVVDSAIMRGNYFGNLPSGGDTDGE